MVDIIDGQKHDPYKRYHEEPIEWSNPIFQQTVFERLNRIDLKLIKIIALLKKDAK